MEFSYAQGSSKYRQLLKNDVVVLFIDDELLVRHISSNNDVLGMKAGAFTKDTPVNRFMPEDALTALRAFLNDKAAQTVVIEYEFSCDGARVPVRNTFCTAGVGFNDGICLRSYITLQSAPAYDVDIIIAEYETALGYISLINSLSVGVFTHDGNKIGYANEMLGRLLGREPMELYGEPLTKYFKAPGMDARFSLPYIKERMCEVNSFPALAQRKDGYALAVDVNVRKEDRELSYIVTVEDSADYRSRENADSVFRRIFEHSSEAVLMLDKSRTVTWANPAVKELTGYKPESLVGSDISRLYSSEHKPDFYDSIWEKASKQLYRGLLWLRAKSSNLPVMAVIMGIKSESLEASTYIFMFSRAPQNIKLTEAVKDPDDDELTGLYNKKRILQCLEEKLAYCRAHNTECAVLLMDIDRFKSVNELYGVKNADMLLQQISARLKKLMPEGTALGRDDDEFLAIIDEPNATAGMDDFASGLVDEMNRPFYIEEMEIDIFVSIGIVYSSDVSSTVDAVVKSLKQTLSVPKLDWKSSYQIYKGARATEQSRTFEEALRTAIIKNEFVLYYLPTLDVRTQKLVALEALLRWQSPQMRMVLPGEFISVAEGAGLMPALGEQVFSMACQQLQIWNRRGYTDIKMTVNVSSMQLKDEHLAEKFIKTMAMYDIDPDYIQLDFTESIAFQESNITDKTLKTLVDAGVKITIDDFGTGYLSIGLFKKYPIDRLKIDRVFIKSLPDNADNCAIVSAVIAMAHSLGMSVCAEGVETMTQFEYIMESGCDQMQGFFIGRPSTAEEIEQLMQSYATPDLDI